MPVSLSGDAPRNFNRKGIRDMRLPSTVMLPVGAASAEIILQILIKYSLCSSLR
jgi:hypothetical protein